jgi:oligopeptidase B
MAYLKEENEYTENHLSPLRDFQQDLYKETLSRIKETDSTAPCKLGDYVYYSRTEEGKQYSIYCRQNIAAGSKEEIILDLNKVAEEGKHEYLAIGDWNVSPDGKLLAYSLDFSGYRQYLLQVMNLETGIHFHERIARCTDVEWCSDNKTLFYVTEDPKTKRSNKVFRIEIGSKENIFFPESTGESAEIKGSDAKQDSSNCSNSAENADHDKDNKQEEDDEEDEEVESATALKGNTEGELIFEEKDEMFSVGLSSSNSERFIFLNCCSAETSEVHVLNAKTKNPKYAKFHLFLKRKDYIMYNLDHQENQFLLVINDKGRNFRLVSTSCPPDNFDSSSDSNAVVVDSIGDFFQSHEINNESRWKELIPHRSDVKLDGVECFKTFFVAVERTNGLPLFRVWKQSDDFKASQQYITTEIKFPEVSFSAYVYSNLEYDTHLFRYGYQSFVTPPSVFDYNVNTNSSSLVLQKPVLGKYDSSEYVVERISVPCTSQKVYDKQNANVASPVSSNANSISNSCTGSGSNSNIRHDNNDNSVECKSTGSDDIVMVPVSLVYRKSTKQNGVPAPCLLYGVCDLFN